MKEAIRDVLGYYESRIIVRYIHIYDDTERNTWIVNIFFYIKNLNITTNVEVLLRRTR